LTTTAYDLRSIEPDGGRSNPQVNDGNRHRAAPCPARHTRDPGHRVEAGKAATIPPAGQALTGAELRLLPLLSTHLSFPEIARELFLSRNTVKSQAISIYQKLGASSRSQAVARSRELRFLEG
jgi:ATP/maltotriose-dependent transcriptional regulator MalT